MSKEATMKPPTIEEVRAYVVEIDANLDPEDFLDYNEKRGWTVGKYGKAAMKCWKAAVRICVRHGYCTTTKSTQEYHRRNMTRGFFVARTDYHERARKDYGDFLRDKTPRALEDLLKDPGQVPPWLIEEILKERQQDKEA